MLSLPTKEELRREMRGRLKAMTADEIASKSRRIVQALMEGNWLPPSSTVALFGGIAGEPDLLPLIPWLLERGSTPVFFGFADGQLVPQRVDDRHVLTRGVFGVWLPPQDAPVVPCEALDVILTPGLAFARDGMRLGRGRGHFDRLFARPEVKARRIGVCWEFQCLETVPAEPHDAPMHAVVTEV